MIYIKYICNITYMQYQKDENIKILAERIKTLRLKKSKSLNKFVFNKSGVTSATWSRIENGLVNPKFTTLIKIASMLDTKIDILLKDLKLDYNIDED